MNPTYLKYELIRAVRNKRGFIISLVFPLIFFYLIAGSNRHAATRRHSVADLLPRRDGIVRHHGRDDRAGRPHLGASDRSAGPVSCASLR